MRGRTWGCERCVVFPVYFEACAITIPLSPCPPVLSLFDGIIVGRTRLWNAPQRAARSASVTLSDSHTQMTRFNRACSHLPLSLPHVISPSLFPSLPLIFFSLSLAISSVFYVQAASILEIFFLSCLTGEMCGKQISDLRLFWLYCLLLNTADRLLSALCECLCYYVYLCVTW